MVRVVGTDPGTSSLDLVLLEDHEILAQSRFVPDELHEDPDLLTRVIHSWQPLDLVAGPSGYGLPLIHGSLIDDELLDQMSLIRPEERGESVGVIGFRAWVRALLGADPPVIFLPGGYHLPSVPLHRKAGAIDMGTADKVAVAALALWQDVEGAGHYDRSTFAVVEVGSAFTAILVVSGGRIVDASAGTRGPLGLRSGGMWDGELAYWRCPISKQDLFRGGLADLGPIGPEAFRESLIRHVAGLQAVTPFERIYASGAGLDRPDIADLVESALGRLGKPLRLRALPNAWVKHAAQGSALLADGLAGGKAAPLVDALGLRAASGSLWDAVGRRH